MDSKLFLKKYFYYFSYFYNYLRYRVFVSLGISMLVGLLDGISLALFIPLLKLITGDINTSFSSNELDFISDFILNKLEIIPSLFNVFLLILLFFSLKGIAQFFETYIRVVYQQYFMSKLRIRNIQLLNKFDFKSFLKADSGRILNSFSGEVNRVNSAYTYYIKAVQFGVLVLVYVVLALGSDWKFTVIVLLGGGIISHIFKFIYKRTKYYSRILTSEAHKFQNLVVQKVHFFKYLKATGLIEVYSDKLKERIGVMEGIQKKLGVVGAILAAIKEPLTILVVFIAIYLNRYFFDQPMTAILLSLILLYRAIVYFMAMQEQYNVFLSVSGSLENMLTFENELRLGEEKNGKDSFEGFKDKIAFQNVSFEFNNGEKVLDSINIDIQKNEILAIIGESGSGKTTLMNIASGLLSPTRGKVTIDETPLNDIDLHSFKKQLGYIVQDVIIFNDSIYNNVTFWAPKSEQNYQRFLKAIKKAALSHFIEDLPYSEETILGSNGINISGGQKQRISIARELYKEVSILFMDEATSSLDGETEAVIQQNINQLKGDYTIIIIAHRLATVKNADRIVMMNKGTVGAVGSFDFLLETSEEFREMVSHQNL